MNEEEIKSLLARAKNSEQSKNSHTPYSERSGEKPDFEVNYEIDLPPDMQEIKIRQGIRCNFLYEGDSPYHDGVYSIWPEFLYENGSVITDKTVDIDKVGRATMWINPLPEFFSPHKGRIKVGTKGFFVVGGKIIAKVIVNKVLNENLD